VARLTRAFALVTSLSVASVALASCGTSGAVAQARMSCHFVAHALRLERAANAPGVSMTRHDQLENAALAELLKATPYAAAATSIDGSWNPLMTTINEAERVPIANLVPSLTQLCRVANSSTPYL
jgi:hypothetical protein